MTWALGQKPPEVFVEGLLEGDDLRKIGMKPELLDAQSAVLRDDEARLTVAPVLQKLEVKIGQGTAPGLFQPDPQQWDLISWAGGAPGVHAGNFQAEAYRGATVGRPRFVQNVHHVNNRPGGKGITYSNDQPAKSYDFAAPHAGQTLRDAHDDPPFYTFNEHTSGTSIRKVEATDSPWSRVTTIIPPGDVIGTVDVTLKFDLWVVWEWLDDGSIWTLGKTEWNVRFNGSLANNPVAFNALAGNANNPSTGFGRTNVNPTVLSGPDANAVHGVWT